MENKKVILLIDDDPDIIESLQAILEQEGYVIVSAMSGNDGITAYKENKPDLVLCDMMMEHIDAGTTVAAEIRKEDPAVPVYLLSSIGNATASNVEISDLGFNGVFQKPVSPSALVSALQKVFERK